MSKYIIPSPNNYMDAREFEFYMHRDLGNKQAAKRVHESMCSFAEAMFRSIEYHKKRSRG